MIVDEIQQFFHGDVAVDDATLTKYSRDYSLFKVRPQVVVFPKDVDDLKNLVKFVSQKKAAGEDVGDGLAQVIFGQRLVGIQGKYGQRRRFLGFLRIALYQVIRKSG